MPGPRSPECPEEREGLRPGPVQTGVLLGWGRVGRGGSLWRWGEEGCQRRLFRCEERFADLGVRSEGDPYGENFSRERAETFPSSL